MARFAFHQTRDQKSRLSEELNVLVADELLSYYPCSKEKLHLTILQQHQKYCKNQHIEIQLREKRFMNVPFSGAVIEMAVGQHCRLAEEKKALLLGKLILTLDAAQISSSISTEESLFWRTKHTGLRNKPFHFWYASDVVLSDPYLECFSRKIIAQDRRKKSEEKNEMRSARHLLKQRRM